MFGNGVIPQLEKGLQRISLQQQANAANIANVNTPNYKSKVVGFQSEFHSMLQAYRSDRRHLSFSGENGQYVTRKETSTVMNHNGNNVDIDQEMAEIAKNQLMNQAMIQLLNSKMNGMRIVIKGGK
ncbi:flagellar basal body rod protein FlgB [Fictibacillus macauensis ZFHKF-1]|uniref:Flagellar basal body rod protein FlgB n=1 Tax=Fictibacillus macauensis ZFHKF-1 TaxID=1196324 RepID=I8AHA6_9BACL|nr:flagellar basal body rod protein FlgB [Fictibacillus macauensis]EIT85077.1 flagellar basal body rod protein FlgB [Fictibacillus macauensis ZFHKF-1]